MAGSAETSEHGTQLVREAPHGAYLGAAVGSWVCALG